MTLIDREEAVRVVDGMRVAWVSRTHQDSETRLVSEILSKCVAAIRALPAKESGR